MRKTFLVLLGLLLLVVGVVAGLYFGKQQGKQAADTNLKNIVDMAFPAPAQDIRSLNGVVTAVYGASVQFEMDSLDDYLPKTDGAARVKETRYAIVTGDTKIVQFDMNKVDKNGEPQQTQLSVNDLKVGTPITVRANENIRDQQKFDASQIEFVKY